MFTVFVVCWAVSLVKNVGGVLPLYYMLMGDGVVDVAWFSFSYILCGVTQCIYEGSAGPRRAHDFLESHPSLPFLTTALSKKTSEGGV